jgi:hypothetical protein
MPQVDPAWRTSMLVVNVVGVIVNALGFIFGIYFYVARSKKQRHLQERTNYLSIELESSRIFAVCLQNPEVWLYVNGSQPRESADEEKNLNERGYWLVCQILNIFEIAISMYREATITKELFVTWIPWFLELGTAGRFAEYWKSRKLAYNYKVDLVQVMNAAIKITTSENFNKDPELALEDFHREVSTIFGDSSIVTQFIANRVAAA